MYIITSDRDINAFIREKEAYYYIPCAYNLIKSVKARRAHPSPINNVTLSTLDRGCFKPRAILAGH